MLDVIHVVPLYVNKVVLENLSPDYFECGYGIVPLSLRGCGLCPELCISLLFTRPSSVYVATKDSSS